jgi:hypothetical protein
MKRYFNKNTTMSTNYGRSGCKDAVWRKGKKIAGKNPDEYRKCSISGKVIRYSHYGNNKSRYNWDIDHIISRNQNGPDDLWNLQPVYASKNRSMGASLKEKPGVMELMFDAMRVKRGICIDKRMTFHWDESIIGKLFWVKASPITVPQIATIVSYNKTSVQVFWQNAGWETTLPLDGSLFEPLSEEGRSNRRVNRNCIS